MKYEQTRQKRLLGFLLSIFEIKWKMGCGEKREKLFFCEDKEDRGGDRLLLEASSRGINLGKRKRQVKKKQHRNKAEKCNFQQWTMV